MTMFTEGRMQAYERMMQQKPNYRSSGGSDTGANSSAKPAPKRSTGKQSVKGGAAYAGRKG